MYYDSNDSCPLFFVSLKVDNILYIILRLKKDKHSVNNYHGKPNECHFKSRHTAEKENYLRNKPEKRIPRD